MRTMQILLPTVALALTLVIAGCGAKPGENPPGYEPKDFTKSGPPPEYRGPGQPGGPQSGPVSGPPSGQ